MVKLKSLAVLAGLGAAIFTLNSFSGNNNTKDEKSYPLPSEIRVIETSFPYEERKKVSVNENRADNTEIEKIVKTDSIDFSKNFYIKTDRYNLIKDEDWLPSRAVGHVMAMPGRLLFWDWNYGWGQDEKKSKAILSMLENNEEIKDLTVRLNHNEAFYDMWRMFTEKDLKERNNLFARATLGTLASLGNEVWAEFSRGSYYNPLTRTAVCYSNIESITAHEIGHHKDFQRFDSDWEYMLSRAFPPSMLYQEWQASNNATKFLSNDDQWQFNRYLIPAFLTYILATYKTSKKILQEKAKISNRFDKKPEIHPLQTLRHFGTLNAGFYAGMGVYNSMSSSNLQELVTYGGFVGGMIGTILTANLILREIIPYKHEKRRL